MEFHQIRHFVAVVETGSFTKGAQREAVSQPAISASIAKLEAEIGVRLLDRRRSSVVPTLAGVRLLEIGKTMLLLGNSVNAELRALTGPDILRLGVLLSLSSGQVSELLASFRRSYPHVTIEVFDGPCGQLLDLLADGQLDAILTISDNDSTKLVTRVLFEEPYVLAVPSRHRFALRQSVSLVELDNEPFVLRTRCECYRNVTEALDRHGVRIRVVYRTDQDDRAFALVAAGIGIAFTPAHFEVPGVTQVPVADFEVKRTIALRWLADRNDDYLHDLARFADSHPWTPSSRLPRTLAEQDRGSAPRT